MPIPHRDTLLNTAHEIKVPLLKALETSERLKNISHRYNAERRKVCNLLYFVKKDTKESKTEQDIASAYERLRCDDYTSKADYKRMPLRRTKL